MSVPKTCPFCGNDADVTEYVTDGFGYAGCDACNIHFESGGGDTGECVRKWNTRPIEDNLAAENKRLREALLGLAGLMDAARSAGYFTQCLELDAAREAGKEVTR